MNLVKNYQRPQNRFNGRSLFRQTSASKFSHLLPNIANYMLICRNFVSIWEETEEMVYEN